MNHLIILPVLLPLLTGALLLIMAERGRTVRRRMSVVATLALVLIGLVLVGEADNGRVQVYSLGNWPAPFGIVLVLDRLSAMMVALTATVGFFCLLFAIRGADTAGRSFHALLQFQLAGLNGAFLAGDLFNLFVFFEILLLGSYGLLLHGGSRTVCRGDTCHSMFGGPDRTRAALHYVVLNLIGSSLFLIAVAMIYSATGTLNMAHLAERVAQASGGHVQLIHAGALLLLVVFALKAAVVPLHFWLPSAYANASAPVAALFVLMTKVGVYAIVRIYTLVFGEGAGPLSQLAEPWLIPLALVTFAAGVVGVMAAVTLRHLVAYLIVVSVGMLLSGIGLFSTAGLSGALYYLVHTTLVSAGLFLLVDLIAAQRQNAEDRIVPGPPVAQVLPLGVLFFVAAVALAGVPPLSGVVGKLLILQAAIGHPLAVYLWTVILVGSLFVIVKFSRTGSMLFWRVEPGEEKAPAASPLAFAAPVGLLAAAPLLVIFGGPVVKYADAAAKQLLSPEQYIRSVLGSGDG